MIRNVFISFSFEDQNEVNLLRGQAKNPATGLEFTDNSVKMPFNSKDAEYIKRKIREKINRASVTMVYLSEKSLNSDWVKWEIEQSIKMGKGVIAVYKGDIPPANIPKYISDNITDKNKGIVKWSHDAISTAVDRAANKR